ncbi:MAG: SAM-dependent DNA methyltransferase [Anaerolineaceae bacterium]|nr:SAM-dependent DNA methyltransferase [Anaerolineaceae bacterium]
MTHQVKTKQRVADHGEVFTAAREVNAMLDLVKQETERIDSRFLEPACGDGNFLAEILRRKLTVVKRKYKKSPIDYEKNAVLAATSIYGVDILQDNVDACRLRMFEIWDKEYQAVLKKEVNEDCRDAVRFIFSRNIVCGNALSLKKVDAQGKDLDEPIVFSEWAFVTGFNLQRSDYAFDKLLEGDVKGRELFNKGNKTKIQEPSQQSMFDEPETNTPPSEGERLNDEGLLLKKYIAHYRKVQENGG